MAEKPGTASPLAVAKAVFWSFFGIRRKSDYESDAARLTPTQVVAAGLIGAALFVSGLILLVKFVISRAA
jgi:hypothetical protein